jgi:hypothetical protein
LIGKGKELAVSLAVFMMWMLPFLNLVLGETSLWKEKREARERLHLANYSSDGTFILAPA